MLSGGWSLCALKGFCSVSVLAITKIPVSVQIQVCSLSLLYCYFPSKLRFLPHVVLQ